MKKKDDVFTINVDQLRHGEKRDIDETCTHEFLDVHEDELSFNDDVTMQGEAYLAGDSLIIHVALVAHGEIPCNICNRPVAIEIDVPDLYHAEPLEDIKGGTFNYREIVREAILLEVPFFAECNGKCPRRKEIGNYLKTSESATNEEEGYRPFADL